MYSDVLYDYIKPCSGQDTMSDFLSWQNSLLCDLPELSSFSSPLEIDTDDYLSQEILESLKSLNNGNTALPKYLLEEEALPCMMNLVSPNDIFLDPSAALISSTDSKQTLWSDLTEGSDTPLDIPESPIDLPESLELMYGLPDQFLSDKIISEITKDGASPDDIIEMDILPFIVQNTSDESSMSESSMSESVMFGSTYCPLYDHCYFKVKYEEEEEEEEEEDDEDIWTPVGSPTSSSSSEVDVVTVKEERIKTPIVPKFQQPLFRNDKKPKKGQKPIPKVKKNHTRLSAKTFNAAMKRTMNMKRATNARRTYRKKINNSVETTPSNSVPSSNASSLCNSDVEDAGKRANHNSSERKRREVLRDNLQKLRQCVPSVESNPKAPKVQILNCAKEFIRELQLNDRDYLNMKQKERRKNHLLMAKLRKLQSEFGLSTKRMR